MYERSLLPNTAAQLQRPQTPPGVLANIDIGISQPEDFIQPHERAAAISHRTNIRPRETNIVTAGVKANRTTSSYRE